jgi:hypothetical protein
MMAADANKQLLLQRVVIACGSMYSGSDGDAGTSRPEKILLDLPMHQTAELDQGRVSPSP